MRMFTVHHDQSIDPWILGKIRRERDGSVLADLFVRDLDHELTQIGIPMVPEIRDRDMELPDGLYPIKSGHSVHSAMVLFILQKPEYPIKYFYPLLARRAFCCGERISIENDAMLASLWFMDYPSWILFNSLVYTLTPSNLLMPLEL